MDLVLPLVNFKFRGILALVRSISMKKTLLVLLSLVPGVVLAEGANVGTKVRVTMKTPESVPGAVSAIQETSLIFGSSVVNMTLDNENNTVEVVVDNTTTADELTSNLQEILGGDVHVEKVNPDSMKLGTQDDIMIP